MNLGLFDNMANGFKKADELSKVANSDGLMNLGLFDNMANGFKKAHELNKDANSSKLVILMI